MDKIEVERIGGFAGFGGPGSRIRSRGELALDTLPSADRQAMDALFASGGGGSGVPDGFRYRITRTTASRTETIEVPEADVPAAIRASVRDELR